MASKTIITKEKAAPFPLITIVEVDSEDVIPEGKSAPVPIITVVEVDSDTIISDEKTAPLPIITITNVASEEITSNEDAAPIPLPDSVSTTPFPASINSIPDEPTAQSTHINLLPRQKSFALFKNGH